jgi:hypothetical protein
MVTGSLRIKNESYYIVISYYDNNHQRKQRWYATGINSKTGSKREANKLLLEYRKNFDPENGEIKDIIISKKSVVPIKEISPVQKSVQPINEQSKILFCDYLMEWVERIKSQLEENTYYDYRRTLKP